MKILLAEDERDLREVVAAYLEYQGHDITTAANGQEALERAGGDAFDAIILDIMMPVMDGVTAMRRLRAEGNTVPAIFLTAKSQVADRVEGLDAGADDYLTKPFAMEELNARLRALYRRRREYKVRTLTIGNVSLDTEQAELRAGNAISLALKEVRLLSFLISNAGRFCGVRELLDEVWPGEDAKPEIVWMYVSFLRAKLASILANVDIDGDMERGFRIREYGLFGPINRLEVVIEFRVES